MPDEFVNTRSGEDRRSQPPRTDNCDVHDRRQNEIDQIIATAKGWVKAASAIASIVVALISFMGLSINTKLNTIMAVQSSDRSDIRLINEQIMHMKGDIQEMQQWHKEKDQEFLRGR